MKREISISHLYFTGITLYLFLALHVSFAQAPKYELDQNIVEPIRVIAVSKASLAYRMDDDRHFLFPRKRTSISSTSSNNVKYAGSRIPLRGFDITGLIYEEKSNGYLIQIQCRKNLPDFSSWFKCEGNDTWLSVTIANAMADSAGIEILKMPGFIKELLIFQSPTSVQLTFRVKAKIRAVQILQDKGGHTILVAVHTPISIPGLAKIKSRIVKFVSVVRKDVW